VATANHYWIDGIVGVMLIIPGVLAARWHPIARMRARRFRFPARAWGNDQVPGDDLVQRDDPEESNDPAQRDNREAAPGEVPSPRSPLLGKQAQRRLITTERRSFGLPGRSGSVRLPGPLTRQRTEEAMRYLGEVKRVCPKTIAGCRPPLPC
jgi:hypothetical protein